MNTQPNTFTWNVMGMMNNAIFRVKIHPVPTSSEWGGCHVVQDDGGRAMHSGSLLLPRHLEHHSLAPHPTPLP